MCGNRARNYRSCEKISGYTRLHSYAEAFSFASSEKARTCNYRDGFAEKAAGPPAKRSWELGQRHFCHRVTRRERIALNLLIRTSRTRDGENLAAGLGKLERFSSRFSTAHGGRRIDFPVLVRPGDPPLDAVTPGIVQTHLFPAREVHKRRN